MRPMRPFRVLCLFILLFGADAYGMSCSDLAWPLHCDCSCWKGTGVPRRLRAAYHTLKNHSESTSLRGLFLDQSNLRKWFQVLLAAVGGHIPSRSRLSLWLPLGLDAAQAQEECRPGIAMLAFLGSRAAVSFLREEVRGRPLTPLDVIQVYTAYEIAVLLSGIAKDLALDCECGHRWIWTPADLLEKHADWLSYLSSVSLAVHEDALPSPFEVETKDAKARMRQKLFFQSGTGSGPMGLCPSVGEVSSPRPPPQGLPRLLCVVPALWPREKVAMASMAATTLADCDRCTFYVASKDSPKELKGCGMVDLSDEPEVGQDPPDNFNGTGEETFSFNPDSNLVAKAFHMLLHASVFSGPVEEFDWLCLIETDVYFIAANLRRLVTLLGFSPTDPHWVGHEVLADIAQNGIAIEPNSGSCLSAFAVRKIGQFYTTFLWSYRKGVQLFEEDALLRWNKPPLHPVGCQPFGLGGQGFYQSVLTACFRAAGVYPTDPRSLGFGLCSSPCCRRLFFNSVVLSHFVVDSCCVRRIAPTKEMCTTSGAVFTFQTWRWTGLQLLKPQLVKHRSPPMNAPYLGSGSQGHKGRWGCPVPPGALP